MPSPIPPPIYLHLTAALSAFVLGIVMLVRRKGTKSRKALGWVWVTLMNTVAVTSLWIPSFLHFTWIHLFTLLTAVTLPLAIWRIRHGNVRAHAEAMKGLLVGAIVIAGVFAFVPGRLLGNRLWKGVWGYL